MLDVSGSLTGKIIDRCEALFGDLNFELARAWKAAQAGRKVVGFMPYYVPRELIYAAGCLPLGIMGGDQLGGDPRGRVLPELPTSAGSRVRRLSLGFRGVWILLTGCCFRRSAT